MRVIVNGEQREIVVGAASMRCSASSNMKARISPSR